MQLAHFKKFSEHQFWKILWWGVGTRGNTANNFFFQNICIEQWTWFFRLRI